MNEDMEKMLQEAKNQNGEEGALRYFFLMAINAKPYVQKTMQTNYGDEIECLLKQQLYQMFERIVEEHNLYPSLSRTELKWVLRYHSYAIMGILRDWTDEDTKNLDQIVHEIYLLIMGKVSPVLNPLQSNSSFYSKQCPSYTLGLVTFLTFLGLAKKLLSTSVPSLGYTNDHIAHVVPEFALSENTEQALHQLLGQRNSPFLPHLSAYLVFLFQIV